MLDTLVKHVLESRKYRRIAPDVVARIGAWELKHQPNFDAAVKATKNKLHQTASAYLASEIDYGKQLTLLETADDRRAVCRQVMRLHSSTAERLSILDTFFTTTLASLGPVTSVLDIACGLNPLALPWLPLAAGCTYHAYDIFSDMIAFLNAWFALAGVQGQAHLADIGTAIPSQPAQIALILKTLPCLEQADKTLSERLLDAIQAPHLLISFPVRSLGGKQKGMADTYTRRMEELTTGRNWTVQRFEFDTELAFLVSR